MYKYFLLCLVCASATKGSELKDQKLVITNNTECSKIFSIKQKSDKSFTTHTTLPKDRTIERWYPYKEVIVQTTKQQYRCILPGIIIFEYNESVTVFDETVP